MPAPSTTLPSVKIRTQGLIQLKAKGLRFACITAYDYPGALATEAAGVEADERERVGDLLVALAHRRLFPFRLDV